MKRYPPSSSIPPAKSNSGAYGCGSQQFRRGGCRADLHLPQELVREIFIRLPAKSVSRFRCLSTAWLFILTDPSFTHANACRAPITWLVRSAPNSSNPEDLFHNLPCFFLDNAPGRNSDEISSHTPRSSCEGLVLFYRNSGKLPTEFYVTNLLTGAHINLPNPSKRTEIRWTMELYYHRRTREHRLINFRNCEEPAGGHLDAEVLSLTNIRSWRQIKAKAPFVSLFYHQSRVVVNDRLYWTCQRAAEEHTILVFDILKETFSLMDLPSYGRETLPSFADAANSWLKYGLVAIEGNLCCWTAYRDESCPNFVRIDVWAAVDGDGKWKKAHSLCLVDEFRSAFCYPCTHHLFLDGCRCIGESVLLFLFDTMGDEIYLFRWDLRSGKYWTKLFLETEKELLYPALTYRESLVEVLFRRPVPPALALLNFRVFGVVDTDGAIRGQQLLAGEPWAEEDEGAAGVD